MAEEQTQEQQGVEDESLAKLAWGYVGVGVLWLALVLTGIAFERLGLTTTLFSGVLPGEVGSLRLQNAEYEVNLKTVTQERDVLSRRADTFRRQVEQAENKAAELQTQLDQLEAAAPAAEATAAPDA
jgi:hypothetical protein